MLAPFELGFALDGSNSLTRSEFNKVKDFVRSFVNVQTISRNAAQVGVIEYSDKPKIEIALNDNSNSASLRYDILYIRQSRGTKAATAEMIEMSTNELFSRERGARPGVPRYLVILTDENVTPSNELKAAVRKAAEEGIEIYVIDIGDKLDLGALKLLAPIPKNRYGVDDVGSLSNIILRIRRSILDDVTERKLQS